MGDELWALAPIVWGVIAFSPIIIVIAVAMLIKDRNDKKTNEQRDNKGATAVRFFLDILIMIMLIIIGLFIVYKVVSANY